MEIKMKKAFTLVELLVVISIIALLLSIMMPALQKAKKLGQSSICLANIRQIAVAYQCYSIENNGKLMPSRIRQGRKTAWVQFPQNKYGANTWSLTKQGTLEERIFGITAGLLYPYLKTVKVYFCSGDPRMVEGTHAERSYSMIGCLNGWSNVPAEEYMYDRQIKKMDEIKSTSTSYMLVEEADSRGFNMTWWSLLAPEHGVNPPMWWNPLAVLHGDSSTIAFCDGHARLYKWREKLTLSLAQKQMLPGVMYGATPVLDGQRRDIDFMYDGWAYKYTP
jgi:prepilin-type N-terminal cleavage/methylation domain-containing protein/prepilin-type processing-associated H-X9-DG protein